MKAEFANPLYNLSPSVRQRSRLPVDHPDYSPEQACPPKLLFPAARRQNKLPHQAQRHRSPSSRARPGRPRPPKDSDEDEDDAELDEALPKKLTFQKELDMLESSKREATGVDRNGKSDATQRTVGPVLR